MLKRFLISSDLTLQVSLKDKKTVHIPQVLSFPLFGKFLRNCSVYKRWLLLQNLSARHSTSATTRFLPPSAVGWGNVDSVGVTSLAAGSSALPATLSGISLVPGAVKFVPTATYVASFPFPRQRRSRYGKWRWGSGCGGEGIKWCGGGWVSIS